MISFLGGRPNLEFFIYGNDGVSTFCLHFITEKVSVDCGPSLNLEPGYLLVKFVRCKTYEFRLFLDLSPDFQVKVYLELSKLPVQASGYFRRCYSHP